MAQLIKRTQKFRVGGGVIPDLKIYFFDEKPYLNLTKSNESQIVVKKGANSNKWKYLREQVNKLFKDINFESAEDVAKFQLENGLDVDGMLGLKTLNKLNEIYDTNISINQIKYPTTTTLAKRKEQVIPEVIITAPRISKNTKDSSRAKTYEEALILTAQNKGDSERDIRKLASKYGKELSNWKGTKSYNDFYNPINKQNTLDLTEAVSTITTLPLRFAGGLTAGTVDLAANEGLLLLTGKTATEHLQNLLGNSKASEIVKYINFGLLVLRKPVKGLTLAKRELLKKSQPKKVHTTTKNYTAKSYNPNTRLHQKARIANLKGIDNPIFKDKVLKRINKRGGYKIDNPDEFFKINNIKGKEVWYEPPKQGIPISKTNSGTFWYFSKGGLIPKIKKFKI